MKYLVQVRVEAPVSLFTTIVYFGLFEIKYMIILDPTCMYLLIKGGFGGWSGGEAYY